MVGTDPDLYTKVAEGVALTDAKTLEKVNDFLQKYPKSKDVGGGDEAMSYVWTDLPVKVIVKRSIDVAIDIINDISDVLSRRENLASASMRRAIFAAFTKPERRLYVGFWLIFLSFVLYFIDAAA